MTTQKGIETMKSKFSLFALAFTVAVSAALAQEPTPLVTQGQDQLIAVLKSSDASRKAKADACRELAVIGGREAVPVLVGLLSNPEMNHMARYALETIPDPAVSDALRDQLGKLKGLPLVGVIGSVGVRKDPKAVEPLAALLSDSDLEVACGAARALGSIGTPAAAQALKDALSNVTEDNLLAFCEGFARCAESLAANGHRDQALEIYGEAYKDDRLPHQVRAAALRGAVLLRGMDGLPILREALHSDDYTQFAAANRIALELPGPEVNQLLCDELGKLTADQQVVVVGTLAERGDPAALNTIIAAIQNGAKAVRLASIRALARIPRAESVPTLVKLLNDGDRDAAQAAKESLAGFADPAADVAIAGLLASNRPADRLTAIDLIGRRQTRASVPDLFKAAGDASADVRVAAIKQIGELGSAGEVPKVLEVLVSTKDARDRGAAEQALTTLCAKSGGAEANGAAVSAALAKAQPEAKSSLLEVLASIGGPDALQSVSTAAKDSNSQVRGAAIRALSSWKTADAAPALFELASKATSDTDKTLTLTGYLTLAGNTDLPAPQRLDMCRQAAGLVSKTAEKNLLLAALGALPSVDALPLALPYLDDAATRDAASAAVLTIADKLLQGQTPKATAAGLVAPLQKVAQATGNADLAKRAKALAQRAATKAGQ